ncbi:MAG TPA: PQQ-binding-like beta-propeller repeat protein [Vicinamibacterales bacterium]|nr:PQQ-binding-like beta-propeller repeat protein [Vicinamibacterales bacterium]
MIAFSVQRSRFRVLVPVLVLVLVPGLRGAKAVAERSANAADGQNADWALHNLDLAGTRFSPLDQINTTTVKSLAPRWLFQHGVIDGVSNQTTPVIVNGVMYVTDPRGSVYALDGATGHLLWSYDVTEKIGGGAKAGYIFRNRGVCYGDGVIYAGAGSFLFALDAKSGRPIPTFGKDGQASVILDVIQQRFPDVTAAIALGYWFTTAPQFYNGAIYIGSTRSESHIPGGHVLAVDAKTGKVRWHFNTIPQDDKDQGWAVAGPTWVGGERNGGGIWETPTVDPELGRIYVAVGNPFGDSTKRLGTNLFTDSIISLSLADGHLEWYYQQTHHDLWDYDSGNQPVLFDMQVRGQRVRALAEASKNGYLYILNRETGQPVHPIKEMPVPTASTRAGEQAWPTQPIPFTARGEPMKPVSPVIATEIPPDRLATRTIVPQFTPPGPNQISAPGTEGGANYGPIAFGRQTGWLYVTGVDSPLGSGRPARGYLSAFDPTTGELVWQKHFDGHAQAGTVVTAGGLVFAGSGSNTAGYFYAYDAKTGDELWKFNTGAGIFSSPSVYMVNGEEFVTVASGGGERGRRGGDLILSFALPAPR